MGEFLDIINSVFSSIAANAPYLVGLFLPPLVQYLNRDIHDQKERFWVSVAVCMVVATLLKWQDLLAADFKDIGVMATLIFTESQIVFKSYFRGSFIEEKIQRAIEAPASK